MLTEISITIFRFVTLYVYNYVTTKPKQRNCEIYFIFSGGLIISSDQIYDYFLQL